MFALRDYQRQILDDVQAAARKKDFVLVQAPTGAGKTVIFSLLARHYVSRWHFRVLILAHRALLVRQALDKLQVAFPEEKISVAAACASVSSDVDFNGDVVAASPQTLTHHLDELPAFDVVIVDECHRTPPPDTESQYGSIFRAVCDKRAGARIVGFTATPWRLGQGKIYGPENCWWKDLDSRVEMKELQSRGWLAQLKALTCPEVEGDLSEIELSGGDFNEAQLSAFMSRTRQLGSAVRAFQSYASSRRHVAVFCVDIQHARAMAKAFRAAGYGAAALDSERTKEENASSLRDFDEGRLRVLCSVGMLTEGWDSPQCDCMIMCRPTMSPALYVQMTGRGLRTAPGKEDCLLLDLAGNVTRHGSPNRPRLDGIAEESGLGGRRSESRTRSCPWCRKDLPDNYHGAQCPWCRMTLSPALVQDNDQRIMQAVDMDSLESAEDRAEAALKAFWERRGVSEEERERMRRMKMGQPFDTRVRHVGQLKEHLVTSGAAAGTMIRKFVLALDCPGSAEPMFLTVLLDPGAQIGRRTHKFWISALTRAFWEKFATAPVPRSPAEMEERWNEVDIPEYVSVRRARTGFLSLVLNTKK